MPGTWEWKAMLGNHLHRYRFAASQLAPMQPKRVLDVACGVGYGAEHLHRTMGCEVVGVDRDAQTIKAATRLYGGEQVRFVQGDAEALATVAPPFDAIVSFETIEHLPHPERLLQRSRELLRPGGVFIGSTPNTLVKDEEENPFHLREITPTEFRSLMQKAGFTQMRFFGKDYRPEGLARMRLRENKERNSRAWWRRGARGFGRLLGYRPAPVLPERAEDFSMMPLDSLEDCERRGQQGPFVIVVVATR